MSSFKLDIDTLPIDIIIFKKQANDFTFVAINKAAEKNSQLNYHSLTNCKITTVIPDAKVSGLFEAMLRVDLSGESEIIRTTSIHNNQKTWLQLLKSME